MYASGSASAGYEEQSRVNKQEQKTTDISKLAWTARGGNALLCANPPAWAGSVANPMNWRVIEQEQVSTLYDLIGLFPGYKNIPDIFGKIAKQQISRLPQKVPGSWNGRIRLVLDSASRRFAINHTATDSLVPVPIDADKSQQPEVVFTVLDANIHQATRMMDNVCSGCKLSCPNVILT